MRTNFNKSLLLQRISKELRIRNLKRIEKRKYFGLGKITKEYKELIQKTLFNKTLIKQVISDDLGSFDFTFYLDKLNNSMEAIHSDISKFFEKTLIYGSKKVLNVKGDTIKFKVFEDAGEASKILATQQMDYLKGITENQVSLIKTELSTGSDAGLNINDISTKIMSKVENMTKTRALRIARTEITKTTNQAQINTLKQFGAKHYIYWTANDKKTSKICLKLQGPKSKPKIYDVDKAGRTHPLPVFQSHINCRCTILVKD